MQWRGCSLVIQDHLDFMRENPAVEIMILEISEAAIGISSFKPLC